MLESTQYAAIKLFGFVESFYDITRFGHSKDISYYFSDDESKRNDYFVGLIIVFSIIMATAAMWLLVLTVLRLLGPRVGCASGNPATIPAESMMSKGSSSVHTDETGEFIVMQSDQSRVNRTRVVYFISGLYAFFSCAVLIYSINRLMNALTSIHDSAEDALINVENAKVDSLLSTANEFATLRDDLVTDLSGFCSGATVNVHGLDPADTVSKFESLLNLVGDIANNNSWALLKVDVTDLNTLLNRVASSLGVVDGPSTAWFVVTMSSTCTLLLLCLYMLVSAWRAGKKGYQFVGEQRKSCGSIFLHYFATPLFALLLAGAWFSTSFVFTSQAANSDFCYDEITTGETALRMLIERGYARTSDAYLLVDEYLHGCDDKNMTPNALINAFEITIEDAYVSAMSFQDLTPNDDITALETECGANTADIVTKSNTAIEKLNALKNEFDLIQTSMSCETMAPIMQEAVYETSCNSLSRALLWSFIAGLCVSFFGTVMLTLRSATLRPQIYIVTPNPLATDNSSDLEDYSF